MGQHFSLLQWKHNAPHAAVATIQKELLSAGGREVECKHIKLKDRAAPQDFKPFDYELARICGFIDNMPHIIHAIVNGMKDAHTVGLLHCDLHTRNICLDFTRDHICKVGIIDWGLLLLEGQHRPSETYTAVGSEDPDVIKDIRRREGALQ